jgi:hypothetical protein
MEHSTASTVAFSLKNTSRVEILIKLLIFIGCTHYVHMSENSLNLHVYFNILSYFMAQSDKHHCPDTDEEAYSIS